jgi:hypothetical protein
MWIHEQLQLMTNIFMDGYTNMKKKKEKQKN